MAIQFYQQCHKNTKSECGQQTSNWRTLSGRDCRARVQADWKPTLSPAWKPSRYISSFYDSVKSRQSVRSAAKDRHTGPAYLRHKPPQASDAIEHTAYALRPRNNWELPLIPARIQLGLEKRTGAALRVVKPRRRSALMKLREIKK